MIENLYDPREEMRKFMEGSEKRYANESDYKNQGFLIQKVSGNQIVNVDDEGGNDNE